jgi:uncharacterized membrane protein YccC
VNATTSAARGFVLVFAAVLAFFAFVVASGTLGDVAQAAVGTAIGVAVLLYIWSRLEPQTRERLRVSVRRLRRHRSER